MANATFHNFDSKNFTCEWNGRPKTFKPGAREHMPAWLAEHFAKHLTNRWLIEQGKEVYTSPKNPGQMPEFMNVFKKAFIPDPIDEGASEIDQEIASAAVPSMDVIVKKSEKIEQGPAAALAAEIAVGPGRVDQIVTPPTGDDDEYDTSPAAAL